MSRKVGLRDIMEQLNNGYGTKELKDRYGCTDKSELLDKIKKNIKDETKREEVLRLLEKNDISPEAAEAEALSNEVMEMEKKREEYHREHKAKCANYRQALQELLDIKKKIEENAIVVSEIKKDDEKIIKKIQKINAEMAPKKARLEELRGITVRVHLNGLVEAGSVALDFSAADNVFLELRKREECANLLMSEVDVLANAISAYRKLKKDELKEKIEFIFENEVLQITFDILCLS